MLNIVKIAARTGPSLLPTKITGNVISKIPSSSRTIVTVTNRNGQVEVTPQPGLVAVDQFHSPGSAEGLKDGLLAPQNKGEGGLGKKTPAAMQPSSFGVGAPQTSSNLEAVLTYGGHNKPTGAVKLYQMHLNPYAEEKVQDALRNERSNEYVNFEKYAWHDGRKLNPNQTALIGDNRSAIQLTEKAVASQVFLADLIEVPEAKVSYEQMSLLLRANMMTRADGTFHDAGNRTNTPGNTFTNDMNSGMMDSDKMD